MSNNGFDFPEIKLNDIKVGSDDSFDKKLEDMKAEIEELENDFSTQTLDQLVKQQHSLGSK